MRWLALQGETVVIRLQNLALGASCAVSAHILCSTDGTSAVVGPVQVNIFHSVPLSDNSAATGGSCMMACAPSQALSRVSPGWGAMRDWLLLGVCSGCMPAMALTSSGAPLAV